MVCLDRCVLARLAQFATARRTRSNGDDSPAHPSYDASDLPIRARVVFWRRPEQPAHTAHFSPKSLAAHWHRSEGRVSSCDSGEQTGNHSNPDPGSRVPDPSSPWCRSRRSIETGEAPRGQGGTTENIGQYSTEEQRSHRGCIAGRMPPRLAPRAARLVPWKRDFYDNSRAGHPASRRCSSLTYAQYARSSRLAIRAPRSGTYHRNHASRGLVPDSQIAGP